MRDVRPVQWLRHHPDAADFLFAVVVTAVSLVGLLTVQANVDTESNRATEPLTYTLTLVATSQIALRRRRPLVGLWVVTAAIVPYWILDYVDTGMSASVLVLLYTVATTVERPRSLRHALAVGGLLTCVMIAGVISDEENLPVIAVVGNVVIFVTAWTIGDSLRNRRAYLAEVEARAERAERDREAAAERAVQEERVRIARELHDVVAHSVSVMVVQSAAARRVFPRDPSQAEEALGVIERMGRDALDELRRLLGVLRAHTDDGTAIRPQPTAADVADLVGQWREAGMDVDLTVDAPDGAPELPPGVSLTVYRVAQEALTNVMKHAGPARVEVHLRLRDDHVTVQVSDDGRGPQSSEALPSAAQGLVGMRERVELFGGELRTGPRPGGGFQVRAELPVTAPAPASS